MNYACGFVFNEDMGKVLLIRKARPEWMAGMLNGVGGKQAEGERKARTTMSRECLEECGVVVDENDWTFFAELVVPNKTERFERPSRVAFFFAKHDVSSIVERSDEHVNQYLTNDVIGRNLAPHVDWLIRFALKWKDGMFVTVVQR